MQLSPQAFLHYLLKRRGYVTQIHSYKRSGYYNKPTEYQLASYGTKIAEIIKSNQTEEFSCLMEAGLSPNACNQHGESLVHTVCRHSNVKHFQVLLRHGVDVQQTDDYGRTPMHDCCWASNPSFEIGRELLKRDASVLFVMDIHGSIPLAYCTKKNWAMWNSFLIEIVDELFPVAQAGKNEMPPLFAMEANSRPVPDPTDALSIEMAKRIASGRVDPEDIDFEDHTDHDETNTNWGDDDETLGCRDDSTIIDSKSLRQFLKHKDSTAELLGGLHDD